MYHTKKPTVPMDLSAPWA